VEPGPPSSAGIVATPQIVAVASEGAKGGGPSLLGAGGEWHDLRESATPVTCDVLGHMGDDVQARTVVRGYVESDGTDTDAPGNRAQAHGLEMIEPGVARKR
jgi:hypothetical protein